MDVLRKIFFLIVFCGLSFGKAYSEYIIFMNDNVGKPKALVDEKKYEQVYNILMQFQFPMNTNPLFNTEKKISKSDLELLDKDEHAFLEKKIKENDKNIRLLFVPKTIYELFVISRYMKDKNESTYLTKKGRFYRDYDFLKLLEELEKEEWQTYDQQRFWGLQDKINKKVIFRDEHRYVNEGLFDFVEKHVGIKNFNEKTCLSLVNKLIFSTNSLIKLRYEGLKRANSYFKKNSKSSQVYQYPIEPLGKMKKLQREFYVWWNYKLSRFQMLKLFKNAVSLEYNAFKNGKFVLYRGTSPFKQKVNKKKFFLLDSRLRYYRFESKVVEEELNWSAMSFGISLFSGIFADFGACSYFYYMGKKIGYGLSIDKKMLRKDEFKKVFYLSAMNTISSLCGKGEFFHPRTKIYTHGGEDGPFSYADPKLYDSLKFMWEQELWWSKFLRKNFTVVFSRVSIFNALYHRLLGGDKGFEKRLQKSHENYEKKVSAVVEPEPAT